MEYQAFSDAYFFNNRDRALPTVEVLERTSPRFKQHLTSFIKALPPNARVLDAGCGSGKASFMARVYRPDIELHGVDISDVGDMLPEWIQFKQASVEDIAALYPAEYFDAIMCLHVIEHLQYPIGMVRAFKTVLKTGGRVFLETPNWTRLFIPWSPQFFWNDYTHTRPFSQYALNKLLSEFGFAVEKIVTCSSHSVFVRDDAHLFTKLRTLREHKPMNYSIKSRSRLWEFLKVVFRRVTAPLIPDTLVAVGRKTESV